jgi:FHA domain/PilZ domain
MTVFLNRFGKLIRLPTGITIIGRDPSVDIPLNEAAVSRRHLKVEVDDQERIFIEDLGSTNGTLLNGQMLPLLKRREVQAGDRLQVGIAVLELQREGDLDREPTKELRLPRRAIPTPPPTLLTCSECWTEIPAGMEVCPSCEPQAIRAPDDERRRTPRVPVQIPVIYISGSQSFHGVVRDLGLGGVFIASHRWDPEVTSCQLTLFPGEEQTISISGVVRHAESFDPQTRRLPGLGIKFTDVPEASLSWLQETVDDESAEFFESSSSAS